MERILEMPEELAPAEEVAHVQETSAPEEIIEISSSVNAAYQTLYFAYIVFLGAIGLDKFLHLLTNWDQYVAPQLMGMTSFHGQFITMFAGVVELVLAICIAFRPRAGAWLAATWFGIVAVNLAVHGGMLDLMLLNAMLAVVSVAFGFLAQECN